ncbi:hypothetical protein HYQ46_005968 [Verticillium longisporum]|nr:hypothetical protein HYQ46_005968 [Verticillium longisporum]
MQVHDYHHGRQQEVLLRLEWAYRGFVLARVRYLRCKTHRIFWYKMSILNLAISRLTGSCEPSNGVILRCGGNSSMIP